MQVKNPDEAKEFVKRWMDDRKVFKSDASDKNKDTAYFFYEGASNIGISFVIQQPKNIVRVVGIVAKIALDTKQLKALADLGEKRDDFIQSLSDRLLFLNPTFILGPEPENPEWILFIKEISYDELTEGRLIDGVDQINRAVIFASSIIADKLGNPEGE
jgi:hypothetical protein